jgi:hypothetical protein
MCFLSLKKEERKKWGIYRGKRGIPLFFENDIKFQISNAVAKSQSNRNNNISTR